MVNLQKNEMSTKDVLQSIVGYSIFILKLCDVMKRNLAHAGRQPIKHYRFT